MELNNIKNLQVCSIHGRDLVLPRKVDIDKQIYVEAADDIVTALFDYTRRTGKSVNLDPRKVYTKVLKNE